MNNFESTQNWKTNLYQIRLHIFIKWCKTFPPARLQVVSWLLFHPLCLLQEGERLKKSLFIWNIETMERCNDGDVKMWSLGRGQLLHLLLAPDHDRGDTATLKFPVYKSQTIKLYRTLHTFVVFSSRRIFTLRKYMRLKWNLEWNIYALSHIRESDHIYEWSLN